MDNEAGVSLKWQWQRSCEARHHKYPVKNLFIIFFNYSNPCLNIFGAKKAQMAWWVNICSINICSHFLSRRVFTFFWKNILWAVLVTSWHCLLSTVVKRVLLQLELPHTFKASERECVVKIICFLSTLLLFFMLTLYQNLYQYASHHDSHVYWQCDKQLYMQHSTTNMPLRWKQLSKYAWL